MEVSGKRKEVCGICKLSGISTQADGFCNECDVHMCLKCFQGHLISRPCRHHVLGPVSDGETHQQSQVGTAQRCKKHANQYIRYYCRKHAVVTCGDCIVTDHLGCQIEFINAIAKDFQDNSEFKEYFRKIEKLEEENTGYCKRLQSSISEGFTWAKKALNDIKQFRKKLNDALDRAEKELIDELDRLSKEATTITSDLKARESKVEKDINDLKNDLDTNKYHGDDLFIRFVESKPMQLKIEQSIAEIRRRIDIKSFTFEPGQQLNELIGSNMKLGKIKENIEPCGSQKADTQTSSRQYSPPDPRASGFDVGKKVKYVGPVHRRVHHRRGGRASIYICDADGNDVAFYYGDNGTITNVEENGVVHVSWSTTGQTYRHNAGRNDQFDVALI